MEAIGYQRFGGSQSSTLSRQRQPRGGTYRSDRLDEHLKNGGNLKNYVPLRMVTVVYPALSSCRKLYSMRSVGVIIFSESLASSFSPSHS